jgi:ribosomal protein S18 acetylase RimI-like enzyme
VTLVTQSDSSRPLHGHWLVALWVRPFARRMGVGRLLCGAVLDESGRRGARAVRLTVRSGNEAAIRLYQNLGFSVLIPDAAIAAELDRLRGIEGAPYVAMEAQVRDRG